MTHKTGHLLIHNGNTQVKSFLAEDWAHTIAPNIADTWNMDGVPLSGLQEKIAFLNSKGSVISDHVVADGLDLPDIMQICQNLNVTKVLSDRQQDLQHLDHCWLASEYDFDQWFRASIYGLSWCDETVCWHDVRVDGDTSLDPVVFTPGRSGTNLLGDLLKIWPPNLEHYDSQMTNGAFFNRVLRSKKIYSILRRALSAQAFSDVIGQRFDGYTMVSDISNYEHHVEMIKGWSPVTFTEHDCMATVDKIKHFADILLGYHLLFNKNITFSFYEDLARHYHKTQRINKNPYQYSTLIANYDEALAICHKYQPFYEIILRNVTAKFGRYFIHELSV